MSSQSVVNDVTVLLTAVGKGDSGAGERLFPIIYEELHRIASGFMRQERADHTLQPTALVHEAYLRLVGRNIATPYENRAHFLAAAALAMRRILINHAKARGAQKRTPEPGSRTIDGAFAAFEERAIDLLALDDALARLSELDSTQAKVVELRFFGGLSVEECAEVLGLSPRTVHYEWAHARAWLRGQLGD